MLRRHENRPSATLPALALTPLLLLWGGSVSAQEVDYAQHFRAFTGEGAPASLEDIVRAMAGVDAVLVGETHTDPVAHWIEAELLRRALESFGSQGGSGAPRLLALSLEMFQQDEQGIVDEYLQDLITESQFKSSARPWEHYDADYRPMVERAKEAGIPIIAANAPRRYVNRVSRLGRESLFDLSSLARNFLPPLPYPEPSEAYREEWVSLMTEMPMEDQCPPPAVEEDSVPADPETPPSPEPPHDPGARMPTHDTSFMENGLNAQTLWDASMAHAVTTFLEAEPGALVLHMVGSFHVENHTGIPEQVEFYRPETRSLVVAMELAEDFGSFDPGEHGGLGDFVILTDKSLDQYYERNCVGGTREGS